MASTRFVGCSLPEPWVDHQWNSVNATIFTEHTRKRVRHMIANAPTVAPIDVAQPITIRAKSDFVDVQPPLHTGLLISDEYLEARFFARLRQPGPPPVVCFEFMSGDVNVPFGTLHVVLTSGSVESQTPTCAIIACPEDMHGVGDHIETALVLAGTEIDRPECADRIILVVSEVAIPFIMDRQTELHTYEERLTLAYTSSAALRQLPQWLRSRPARFYSNSLDVLAKEVEKVADGVNANAQLLSQCLGVLKANHEAICDAASNCCPTQLQIGPPNARAESTG